MSSDLATDQRDRFRKLAEQMRALAEKTDDKVHCDHFIRLAEEYEWLANLYKQP